MLLFQEPLWLRGTTDYKDSYGGHHIIPLAEPFDWHGEAEPFFGPGWGSFEDVSKTNLLLREPGSTARIPIIR